MPRKPKPGLPSRQQILDFIADSGQPAGKREIGRAFGLSGHDKILLKALLKDMADEGLIDSSPGRAFARISGRSMRWNSGHSHIAITVALPRSAS